MLAWLLLGLTAAIVSSPQVAATPEWTAVADALAQKYKANGDQVVCVAEAEAQPQLTACQPQIVAFVRTPDEVDFPTIVKLHRLMRQLDDDPLEDAIWGIVTGPTAADALRVAKAPKPNLTKALTTTGTQEARFTDVVTLLDVQPVGTVIRKTAGGEPQRTVVAGDLTQTFVSAWQELDPGVIVTSSHASERNLEMPFSKGNIVAKDGAFWTCPVAQLIDYKTGHAKGEAMPVVSQLPTPRQEKIWLAPGNCLLANHIPGQDSMVMTALGFGKCNQFMGYAVTSWYGAMGWGTYHKWLAGNKTLGEAYWETQNETIQKVLALCPEAVAFQPVSATAKAYETDFLQQFHTFLRAHANSLKTRLTPESLRDLMGLLWDRDTTVLYGDPALDSRGS